MCESNGDPRIWWIASYPKSGSTWVRLVLDCYVTGFPVRLNSVYRYAASDLYTPFYQAASVKPVDQWTQDEQVYYRPAALMNCLALAPGRDVALKTHHARLDVNGIPLIPAELTKGAVCIVRDPRDVVISFADHCGMSIDDAITNISSREQVLGGRESGLIHALGGWSTHVDSWCRSETPYTVTAVRYEDMCSDPIPVFKSILGGLGIVDVDFGRLRFAIEQTNFEHLQDLEDEQGFSERGKGGRFFRAGRPGQWKQLLTEEQIGRIEGAHRHSMEEFKYEPLLVGA